MYDFAKIKSGDRKEFRKFFEFFYPKLMSFACRFVDEAEAEDLVQDIFTSYWENMEEIDASNIESYFFRWLQNRCLNSLKHQKVVGDYESKVRIAEARLRFWQEHTDHNPIFSKLDKQEIRREIESSIEKLPPKCAQAFRLFYFHDVSQKEIAEVMGISVRTVEGHIHNALKHLREDLKGKSLLFVLLFTM